MVIQLEDCADVMKAIFPDHHFIFLVDHLSGHDKKRKDGLTTVGMTKSFGGSQPLMRERELKPELFGPFENVGVLWENKNDPKYPMQFPRPCPICMAPYYLDNNQKNRLEGEPIQS